MTDWNSTSVFEMDKQERDNHTTVCLSGVQQFREEGIASLSRHKVTCSEKLRHCRQSENKHKNMQRRSQDSLSAKKNSTLNRW